MPVVMATGISVNTILGESARQELEAAMHQELSTCLAEGLSAEKDGKIIQQRIMSAHDRVRAEIVARENK